MIVVVIHSPTAGIDGWVEDRGPASAITNVEVIIVVHFIDNRIRRCVGGTERHGPGQVVAGQLRDLGAVVRVAEEDHIFQVADHHQVAGRINIDAEFVRGVAQLESDDLTQLEVGCGSYFFT